MGIYEDGIWFNESLSIVLQTDIREQHTVGTEFKKNTIGAEEMLSYSSMLRHDS